MRKHRIALHIIIIVAGLGVGARGLAETSGNGALGKLVDFSGAVLVKTGGKWTTPAKDQYLYINDKIVTQEGIAIIALPSGELIYLYEYSSFVMSGEERNGKRRNYELWEYESGKKRKGINP